MARNNSPHFSMIRYANATLSALAKGPPVDDGRPPLVALFADCALRLSFQIACQRQERHDRAALRRLDRLISAAVVN